MGSEQLNNWGPQRPRTTVPPSHSYRLIVHVFIPADGCGPTTETHMSTCNESHHAHHDHAHGPNCGHTAIKHGDHIDYLHDGHLHHPHGDHIDEHRLEVSARNPDQCTPCCGGHDPGHVHG